MEILLTTSPPTLLINDDERILLLEPSTNEIHGERNIHVDINSTPRFQCELIPSPDGWLKISRLMANGNRITITLMVERALYESDISSFFNLEEVSRADEVANTLNGLASFTYDSFYIPSAGTTYDHIKEKGSPPSDCKEIGIDKIGVCMLGHLHAGSKLKEAVGLNPKAKLKAMKESDRYWGLVKEGEYYGSRCLKDLYAKVITANLNTTTDDSLPLNTNDNLVIDWRDNYNYNSNT